MEGVLASFPSLSEGIARFKYRQLLIVKRTERATQSLCFHFFSLTFIVSSFVLSRLICMDETFEEVTAAISATMGAKEVEEQ